MANQERIFYKDLPLDIYLTSNGDISEVTNGDSIKQSLRMIINTGKGTRIFMPDYGARVRAFLFEPFDEFTAKRLGEEIQLTIKNYEKRIQLLNVEVGMDFSNTSYTISVIYKVISTNTIDGIELTLEKL